MGASVGNGTLLERTSKFRSKGIMKLRIVNNGSMRNVQC
jgi:hypothetical protein